MQNVETKGVFENPRLQNPFCDSFCFKNSILDFLKETHP